jgi:Domain of Unknown Function (DUF1259)
MNRSSKLIVLIAVAGSLALSLARAQAQHQLDDQRIAAAAGTKATVKDGIVRIEWPRDDVPLTVDRMPLKPFAGVGSWAAFTAAPHGAMMMGDTVVFQDEVTPALDAALASGLEVTAIHNHFFFDSPKVFFMHIGGMGDAEKLATSVKSVWDAIKKVRSSRSEPATDFGGQTPQAGTIDSAAIEKAIGAQPQTKDGIVKVSIGRDGMMHGVKVGGAMGLNTWAAFSGSDNLAAVDGDFIMTATEVQPVLRSLRKSGIDIVALHNHMIGEEPKFYFLHFWGKGSTQMLAGAIKSALDTQKSAASKHE